MFILSLSSGVHGNTKDITCCAYSLHRLSERGDTFLSPCNYHYQENSILSLTTNAVDKNACSCFRHCIDSKDSIRAFHVARLQPQQWLKGGVDGFTFMAVSKFLCMSFLFRLQENDAG